MDSGSPETALTDRRIATGLVPPRSSAPSADHVVLRSPQHFGDVLAELRAATRWPPGDADLDGLALGFAMLIAGIDAWETATRGREVVDADRGRINTAEARRLLAREVA